MICFVYNPLAWGTIAPAVAAVRAGGFGVLCGTTEDLPYLAARVVEATRASEEARRIGVRIEVEALDPQCLAPWIAVLGQCDPGFVIISVGAGPGGEGDSIVTSDGLRGRSVYWEVTDVAQIEMLRQHAPNIEGWVVVGEEAGGRAGVLSTPLMLQKMRLMGVRETIVTRGIAGVMSAAALYAAGADGVVLDDQLLLLAESPWRERWGELLLHVTGKESVAHGDVCHASHRFLNRPEFPAARELAEQFRAIESREASVETRAMAWREVVAGKLGWRPGQAWPCGQGVAFAAPLAAEYATTGRLVQALVTAGSHWTRSAAQLAPFGPGSALAVAHGTEYPVVQGPMTRVSDRAEFAAAVATAGGLPVLALALMRGRDIEVLLRSTVAMVGERPWAVGVLGFVPPELRHEQIEAVLRVRPRFAIIAGGRPDQARELEDAGIATYLHVPVATLLATYIQGGARRFILEGRECGGHVGPLSSLVLWEQSVATLLREVAPGEESNIHVLFAGGVHDASSAALVAVMAAPLVARGMRVGLLMGTAYVLTVEAAATGAVRPEFQTQVLNAQRSVALETGPGHACRCAVSAFTEEFQARRRVLLRAGADGETMKNDLEQLGVGRLRLATKGLERDAEGHLIEATIERQREAGMYMIGEAVTLRSATTTIRDLHTDVCQRSHEVLGTRARRASPTLIKTMERPAPSDIAVIGMSVIVPGSENRDQFWTNLLQQRSFITEVPRSRFDWRLFYDSDPAAHDKIVSKWGGFIADVPFDPLAFGIPPNSLKAISPIQLIVLEGVRRALGDAGLERVSFDRENTEVLVANGRGGGFYEELLGMRAVWPLVMKSAGSEVDARLPQWTNESFPGCINSIAAGRVANRFDLGGLNFTVDAACAASLTAIELAVNSLESRRSNLVIAGGVDLGNTPYGYMAFSKTQALSPDGVVRTFDRNANGIVLSEGAAFFVLKRRCDAERDGDRIYGLIRGIGGSSDGRELGLTAPRAQGQRRALERAYRRAGVGPETVGLYEAHGTGTVLGDRTELETIVSFLREAGTRPARCVIGSHKTLLGHTKTAAGAVGIAKALLALAHRTLPPHAGVREPLEPIVKPGTPVAVLTNPKAWLASSEVPRRCGVSAFGFGGVNLHVVLEEYRGVGQALAPGGRAWPAELLLFRAADPRSLGEEIAAAARATDESPTLADFAGRRYLRWSQQPAGGAAFALVVATVDEAKRKLTDVAESLAAGRAPSGNGLYEARHNAVTRDKTALLFPGQGAQYPGMLRESVLYLQDMRDALEQADTALHSILGDRLSDIVFPAHAFETGRAEKQVSALRAPRCAQPALAALAAGLVRVLTRAGLAPDAVAGHSFGEWSALGAAGVLDEDALVRFAERRGHLMDGGSDDSGAMAALATEVDTAAEIVRGIPDVVIANINSPRQTVISGKRSAVERALAAARERRIAGQMLSVAGAFHSPAMDGIAGQLRNEIARLPLRRGRCPVYSNETARPLPSDPGELRVQLGSHLTSPVQFMAMIRSLYADGVRVFVEAGPQRFLSRLVAQCLEDRPHRCISCDDGSGSLGALLEGLGGLANLGLVADLGFLWEGRLETAKPNRPTIARSPRTAAWINGMRVWTAAEPEYGTLPLLDADSPAPTATVVTPPAEPPTSVPETESSSMPMNPDRVTAYTAYQETMRQFLQTQEHVLSTLLGQPNGATALLDASTAVRTPTPTISPTSLPMRAPAAVHVNTIPAPSTGLVPAPRLLAPAQGPIAVTDDADRPVPATSSPGVALEHPKRDDIARILVETMSTNTGYPPDMLGLDRAIEGDLGIDSIKRTEIVHAFVRKLPTSVHGALESRMDALLRTRTMRELVQLVDTAINGPGDRAQPRSSRESIKATDRSSPAQTRSDSKVLPKHCPRFVVRPRAAPLMDRVQRDIRRLTVVTRDDAGLVEQFAQRLGQAGVPVVIVGDEREGALVDVLARARAAHGPVGTIVHLAGVSAQRQFPSDFVTWRRRNQTGVKALFTLVQACLSDLRSGPEANCSRVVVAVAIDGQFGMIGKGPMRDFTAAACAGFLRTLRKEEPNVATKLVDLDPELGHVTMLNLLWDEFVYGDTSAEIGFPAAQRTRIAVIPQDLPAASRIPVDRLPSNAVILATGGATGITAEILRRIAEPGMTIVLVGRTADELESDGDLAGLATADELRRHLLARRTIGEGASSPASIERSIVRILRGRERRATLAALRAKGAKVEYVAADVRDELATRRLMDRIYAEHGRIDAVFHGAGIIADKLIVDKSSGNFADVFDTKADSAYLLARYLRPEGLRLLVFFASTAGRFGNRGQSDYAAANELLNRMAWSLRSQWPSCRVVALNWGPWSGAGMASTAINRRMLDDGITPISIEAGCDFVIREIAGGTSADVEIVAGGGPWATEVDSQR